MVVAVAGRVDQLDPMSPPSSDEPVIAVQDRRRRRHHLVEATRHRGRPARDVGRRLVPAQPLAAAPVADDRHVGEHAVAPRVVVVGVRVDDQQRPALHVVGDRRPQEPRVGRRRQRVDDDQQALRADHERVDLVAETEPPDVVVHARRDFGERPLIAGRCAIVRTLAKLTVESERSARAARGGSA